MNDFTNKEYEKVTIELENKSNLNELQKALKEDGNTKIEIKIKKTSKIYTFSLKNRRIFIEQVYFWVEIKQNKFDCLN